MYLTVFAGGVIAFVFCSYWVYHYVDLSLDMNEEEELDHGERDPDSASSMGYRNILLPFAGSESTAASHLQPLGFSERSDVLKLKPYRKSSV